MNFQIRQAVKANVQGQSADELENVVEDAIKRGEEHLLPGLGVFLEAWWNNADQQKRQNFMQDLSKAMA
ncbi:small acid-soluble spore protein SspI [Viridibacillus sp. FSL R5-0477]|uniref:Small, acid-soluble spore protein I n=1 Tax=Viridibacillus arenosi FSL R5-213 TaxID=1227360 RepID=W4EPQ3_9BACL|nr:MULTISPECIES: small acid-soluble spore protein SspI [Viridibacillus]ETT82560.1 small acid-soluble spore protein SspI [Viridibacillus arenosi FSL R5-213]OMC85527.1 small acid-soluble spore protein SspI [Viridibacillus sp. FSL H8-0123]OMC87198.1 small acid-soluble spore protein SspI [Viridibacillus sp. FSL H7-0596]OMC92358.1 small acid-soluble spore protein SspI [Viridibacillus arenosi]